MISTIICSVDDAKFNAVSTMYGRLLTGHAHEIIRIRDARSMCEGYNRGLSQSRGEVIVFSHDDVEVLQEGFADRLLGHLTRCDLLGIAGATRITGPSWVSAGPPFVYGQLVQTVPGKPGVWDVTIMSVPDRFIGGMCALDGMFLACHRGVVEALGFDEQTFTGFHHYDLDLSYRARRVGYRVGVAADLDVIHCSRGSFDSGWERSAMAFAQKHPEASSPNPRKWVPLTTRVTTKEQIREILNPPHWPVEAPGAQPRPQ